MVQCPECEKVVVESDPNWCDVHDRMPLDMGYRVGESETNYAWYSTLERAWTDRRCK
jgi:hypothetical protein